MACASTTRPCCCGASAATTWRVSCGTGKRSRKWRRFSALGLVQADRAAHHLPAPQSAAPPLIAPRPLPVGAEKSQPVARGEVGIEGREQQAGNVLDRPLAESRLAHLHAMQIDEVHIQRLAVPLTPAANRERWEHEVIQVEVAMVQPV